MRRRTMTLVMVIQCLWSVAAAAVDIEHTSERRLRGAWIAMDICLSCHDMRFVKYRDLVDIGIRTEQLALKHIDQDINLPLMSAMPAADRKAMFGRVPPDLSMIVSAREGGARYVYRVFTGYHTTEAGETSNEFRPGIRMPDVFGYGAANDDARTQIAERIRDVAAFLHWASYPHEEKRRRIGYYVIGYLALLTVLFYLIKRRVWQRLER